MTTAMCTSTYHRHQLTCAKCRTTEGNIAQLVRRDGTRWPALCHECSAKVQRESKAGPR